MSHDPETPSRISDKDFDVVKLADAYLETRSKQLRKRTVNFSKKDPKSPWRIFVVLGIIGVTLFLLLLFSHQRTEQPKPTAKTSSSRRAREMKAPLVPDIEKSNGTATHATGPLGLKGMDKDKPLENKNMDSNPEEEVNPLMLTDDEREDRDLIYELKVNPDFRATWLNYKKRLTEAQQRKQAPPQHPVIPKQEKKIESDTDEPDENPNPFGFPDFRND